MGFFYDDRPSKSMAQHAGIAMPCRCDACGTPTAMQHAFIDRHGSIEQLCANCYTQALEGNESPELARRDRIAATVMAVVGGAALLVWLTGCAGGEVRHAVYDGIPVIEHIDMNDQPDVCTRRYTDGCWEMRVTGDKVEHRIWYSRLGAPYVKTHELGHVKGLRHSAFSIHPFYRVNCATITVGIEGYPFGSLICNDGRKEWIVEQEAI